MQAIVLQGELECHNHPHQGRDTWHTHLEVYRARAHTSLKPRLSLAHLTKKTVSIFVCDYYEKVGQVFTQL